VNVWELVLRIKLARNKQEIKGGCGYYVTMSYIIYFLRLKKLKFFKKYDEIGRTNFRGVENRDISVGNGDGKLPFGRH
jgi:hypothetical protein